MCCPSKCESHNFKICPREIGEISKRVMSSQPKKIVPRLDCATSAIALTSQSPPEINSHFARGRFYKCSLTLSRDSWKPDAKSSRPFLRLSDTLPALDASQNQDCGKNSREDATDRYLSTPASYLPSSSSDLVASDST